MSIRVRHRVCGSTTLFLSALVPQRARITGWKVLPNGAFACHYESWEADWSNEQDETPGPYYCAQCNKTVGQEDLAIIPGDD